MVNRMCIKRAALVVLIAYLMALTSVRPASSEEEILSGVEFTGSVPGVPHLYDCIRNLKNSPQAEAEAQECLQSILSTGYFDAGSVEKKRSGAGKLVLLFHLSAPSATLRSMKIQVAEMDREPLERWLKKNPRNLQVGDIYEPGRDFATRDGIERFYLGRGRAVGISSTVRLDYAARTAELAYVVSEGPRTPPQPELPPYEDTCQDSVGALDWSDLDQYVPIPLVRDMVSLRDLGACFSKNALDADRKALENSQLFDTVKLTFSGPPADRQISLSLRGKRLVVSRVEVRFFGMDEMKKFSAELPLKARQIYVRKQALESVQKLKMLYSTHDLQSEVFEHVDVSSDRSLNVTFEVLVYPRDQIWINGGKVAP